MITDEDLDAAVIAGAISSEAAAALRAHAAERRQVPAVDEENFRLLSGFNDIFVAIASLLLLASVAWIGADHALWLGAAGASVVAWVLAEFFVRTRRMALPAILLLLAFVSGVFVAALDLLVSSPNLRGPASSCLAAAAAWLHWRRFHVPITVAAGAAAGVAFFVLSALAVVPNSSAWLMPMCFAAGLVVFGMAMRWDALDRARLTRRSDVAFWLHLLASPLLVHPVFTQTGVFSGVASPIQTIVVVGMYLALALISLAIDRRALMVSALCYVLYALGALLRQNGVIGLSFSFTGLVIGSALLVLSACWNKSRVTILGLLPASLQAHLPPQR